MKRKLLALLLVCTTGTLSLAHEFWLRPKKFRFAVGEQAVLDFVVGENFTGEYWDLSKHKVEKLELITTYGKKDLKSSVKATKGSNLSYKIASQGTQLIALESNKALIELDAEKFNAYLQEDGLDNIIQRRKDKGETAEGAREHYKRFAKVILQAGTTLDEVYKRRVGHDLEIIPNNNPAKLATGDYMDCRIVLQQKPLAHQLVKVWSILGNRVFLQNMYTEDDGTIRFPISSSGPWMVSTVSMRPSSGTEVDYESMWASLVFGVE